MRARHRLSTMRSSSVPLMNSMNLIDTAPSYQLFRLTGVPLPWSDLKVSSNSNVCSCREFSRFLHDEYWLLQSNHSDTYPQISAHRENSLSFIVGEQEVLANLVVL